MRCPYCQSAEYTEELSENEFACNRCEREIPNARTVLVNLGGHIPAEDPAINAILGALTHVATPHHSHNGEQILLHMVAADGLVHPAEVRVLETIEQALAEGGHPEKEPEMRMDQRTAHEHW